MGSGQVGRCGCGLDRRGEELIFDRVQLAGAAVEVGPEGGDVDVDLDRHVGAGDVAGAFLDPGFVGFPVGA